MPLGDPQCVLKGRLDRQADDLGARDHDFASGLIAEGEGALHELALRSTQQSGARRLRYQQLQLLYGKQFAYAAFMRTRPQTLYGFADSPVALAAWLLDHGDGWGQPAAAVVSAVAGHTVDGHTAGALTRDDVLDNITLYWLTNTGVSAARSYWENKTSPINAANVAIPAAATVFPGEIYEAPYSWTRLAFHKLIYFHKAAEGGHFAAWEQPQIFSEELRAGFKSLRK